VPRTEASGLEQPDREVKRWCELVDLDLDDPTERLVAQFHLRLLQGRA
jgi:hypothetical protein